VQTNLSTRKSGVSLCLVRLPRYLPHAGSQRLWTAIVWLQSLAVIDEIKALALIDPVVSVIGMFVRRAKPA
jgi:hypothetical protein